MALFSRKFIFIIITLLFFISPVLAIAQSGSLQGSDPPPGTSAGSQPGSGSGGGSQPGAGDASGSAPPASPPLNAAENINVKLQVPLPFVPMTCTSKEGAPAVCNLKDYIEGVYKFLIGAGALLAVVMFIVAGYQWMISGGSADRTGAAKKRMWAAAMGLVLALLSYVILNTINEKLVKLELPRVEPIQPFFSDASSFCQRSKDIIGLYKQKYNITDANFSGPFDKPFVTEKNVVGAATIPLQNAECGKDYLVIDGGGQCPGNKCPTDNQACVRIGNKSTCESTDLLFYGEITWSKGFFGGNGFVDSIDVVPVCAKGYTTQIGHWDSGKVWPEPRRAYKLYGNLSNFDEYAGRNLRSISNYDSLSIGQKIEAVCQAMGLGSLKGLTIRISVNDDNGYLFNILPTSDDDFAVDKTCTRSIWQEQGGKREYDFDNIQWDKVDAGKLFQMKDFNYGGLVCNLNIDRAHFPDLVL